MFYSHQLLARKAPLGQIWYSISHLHLNFLTCIFMLFLQIWTNYAFEFSHISCFLLLLLKWETIIAFVWWRMAATMHAKINRRKLNKLNIIKIWYRKFVITFFLSNRCLLIIDYFLLIVIRCRFLLLFTVKRFWIQRFLWLWDFLEFSWVRTFTLFFLSIWYFFCDSI
jgi:hypothetical protein